MTYVFDKEGREMPVREITWGRLTIAWTIFFVIAVAAMGAFQYRLNELQTKGVMLLADQQAKTAERVRVLERQNPLGLRMVGQDSTGQAIWIRPKHRNIYLPSMGPDTLWVWP